MIKCFLWFVPAFSCWPGLHRKPITNEAERFMRGNAEKLVGSTKVSPRFLKESDKFWYSYKTGDGTRYYFVDPKAEDSPGVIDREFMTAEISKYTHGPVNYKRTTCAGIGF